LLVEAAGSEPCTGAVPAANQIIPIDRQGKLGTPIMLPSYVADLAYEFGEGSAGESTISVWVIVVDGVAGTPAFLNRRASIAARIRAAIRQHGVNDPVYVYFRTTTEQAALEDEPEFG
jgi:hypothetical protein